MRYIFKSLALLALIILCSCKDSSTNPSGGAAGNMIGYVFPVDTSYQNLPPNDSSGFRISLDGTNYSALTDPTGRWELTNIPAGIYNISFTKTGYATEKYMAYKFPGNGTDYVGIVPVRQIARRNASFVLRPFEDTYYYAYRDTFFIDKIGDTTFYQVLDSTLHSKSDAEFSCRIFRNASTESLPGNAMILFGKSAHLDPLDPATYLYSMDDYAEVEIGNSPGAEGYNFPVNRATLYRLGFQSGETIYCQAFVSNISYYIYNGFNEVLAPGYFDFMTGKQIYTCFGDNHSEVKSFVLP